MASWPMSTERESANRTDGRALHGPPSPAGVADTLRGWAPGTLSWATADGTIRINLGGVLQPRFQFLAPVEAESTSSHFMRRARVDLNGSLLNGLLRFRLLPELAGQGASLMDGWVELDVTTGLRFRAGQFVLPFQWQRFVSGSRQHFTERGDPSQTFGFAGARDAGIALFGSDTGNTVSFGAGLFDGAGRNVRVSNSSGLVASGRVTWAPLGTLPREESDLAFSQNLQTSLGLGLQGGNRSEVRAWDLGRSAVNDRRADWVTGTADASVRWRGISAAGEVYMRRVDPNDPEVDSYTGWAHMTTVGYFLVPTRIEVVGRYARLRLDRDDPDTRSEERALGLNLYHAGHALKSHFHYWNRHGPGGTEHLFVAQMQLLF